MDPTEEPSSFPSPPPEPASHDPWSDLPKFIPSDSPDHPDYKRQRGAQPGNLNALKHGFYSKRFKPAGVEDLEQNTGYSLEDEVDMLRLYARRVIELGNTVDSVDQGIKILRVLCITAQSLTRMLKVEAFLRKQEFKDPDLPHVLSQALAGMLVELESNP